MRIAVAADERVGVAEAVVDELRRRGHEPIAHGALAEDERDDWAWASEAAARDVAEGRAEQAVVCCWTGTGASIAANKVAGIRAALCGDAATADGRPALERRQRARAQPADDLRGRAGRDPRRLVRRRAVRRGRRPRQRRPPGRDRVRTRERAEAPMRRLLPDVARDHGRRSGRDARPGRLARPTTGPT